MPQTRFTTSALGLSIEPSVEAFIKANSKFLSGENPTPDDGAKILAHTICYAIAKALSSPSFATMLNAANLGTSIPIVPPAPSTIGAVMLAAISASTMEI